MTFYPALQQYINEQLLPYVDKIPEARRAKLVALGKYIAQQLQQAYKVQLVFICTHNSRRSHLADIWTQVAAQYYGLDNICCFSGGTEATAFHPNAVAALQRAGFVIVHGEGDNPEYRISAGQDLPVITAYSKVFDAPENPQQHFIAVMVCSDADENCPFIPGAAQRVSLPYDDPKAFDGTHQEQQQYTARCKQIATECFFLIKTVQQHYEQG